MTLKEGLEILTPNGFFISQTATTQAASTLRCLATLTGLGAQRPVAQPTVWWLA